MNFQDASNLRIPEGYVRTIHDKNSRLLWGSVGYDVSFDGSATQTTYSGKNLFDLDTAVTSFENPDGVVQTGGATYSDGVVTMTWTLGASGRRLMAGFKPTLVEGTTYTLSADVYLSGTNATNNIAFGSISSWAQVAIAGKDTWIRISKTFTATSADVADSRMLIEPANSGNTLQYRNVQLEVGSTATDFQSYVGGIPAPNPSYPQPISVVTGENVVKVVGKNLMPLLPNGSITTSQKLTNGTLTVGQMWAYNKVLTSSNGIISGSPLENTGSYYIWNYRIDGLLPNTVYTFSMDYSITMQVTGQNIIAGVVLPNMPVGVNTGTIVKQITTDADGSYIPTQNQPGQAFLNLAIGSSQTSAFAISNLQLELGSTASDYQAFQSQTKTVNLGKNLVPFTNQDFTLKNVRYYAQDGSLYIDGTSTGETSSADAQFKSNFAFTLQAGTYTASHKTGLSGITAYIKKQSDSSNLATLGANVASAGFTLTEPTAVYLGFYVYQASNSNVNTEIQLEAGSATSFAPYFTPLELAKIGTYQDRIYKDGEKWYIEKQTTSIDLGDFTWNYATDNQYAVFYVNKEALPALPVYTGGVITTLCTALTAKNNMGFPAFANGSSSSDNSVAISSIGTIQRVLIRADAYTSVASFTTGMSGQKLYYALATPTTTEITDSTLVSQLNAIYDWIRRYGYSASVRGDLPIIINRTAIP